ncbi:MAG TPA: aminopeptidase [Thermoplasmata archaeon]|nr:aminopeptidase [Thermoplasmata archaeon]
MAQLEISDAQRSRTARAVLTKNLKVRPGERVTIEAWTHTIPWAAAFAREARRLGAIPMTLFEEESAFWDAVDHGDAATLGSMGAHEGAALRQTDVYLHMWGPGDRVRLNALPAKLRESLFAWNDGWYRSARRAKLRGARLELGRPYPTLARAYRADEAEWSDQLLRATAVDPARLARAAAPLVRALARGRSLRIRASNGTDVTLGLARRPVRALTGTVLPPAQRGPFDMLINLPAGVVTLALDESVADGTIVANRTNYYDDGVATGATFHFGAGRLTEATFRSGGERFQTSYRSGGRGRDRPGMLRLGLNPELHNTPQVEDLERGAVMVSVGGNRFVGGKNPSPFFGWAITAGATVEVDGQRLRL